MCKRKPFQLHPRTCHGNLVGVHVHLIPAANGQVEHVTLRQFGQLRPGPLDGLSLGPGVRIVARVGRKGHPTGSTGGAEVALFVVGVLLVKYM